MNDNLNLTIYNYIKAYGKLPKHNTSEKSKYAYHCRKLIEQGKIKKLGYGVWEAKEVQTSSNIMHTTTETIRSHGYRFYLRLPVLDIWDKREYLLHKFQIPYKKIPQGQIVKVRRHNIYLYKDTIQITFRKGKGWKSADPVQNNRNAIMEFKKTIQRLSNLLKTDFKIDDNNYLFNCHHADVRNEIADYYYSRGIRKFSITDSNGEIWLLMDNSFNLLELETIHPVSSTRDMKEVIQPFMNKLKQDPLVLDNLDNKLNETKAELYDIIKSQAYQIGKLIESQNELVNYIKNNPNR